MTRKQAGGKRKETMNNFFHKLFNVYAGEEKNALNFALLAFLWAFAVSLGWKNADALFLLNVGSDSLPFVYGIIALTMLGIVTFLNHAYDEYPAERIFIAVVSIGIVFYIGAYFCLFFEFGNDGKWLWYALRTFGWIFFAVANTSYWTFVDQFYHIRDSKRLFSLFSSAIFIGVATTGAVMNTGWFEFREVCLIILLILVATLLWVRRTLNNIDPLNAEQDMDLSPVGSNLTFKEMIREILRSKFTLFLMSLNFMNYISLVLAEFNYMSAFEAMFGGGFAEPIAHEEDAPLTIFLGKCIASVSIFNLVFGLFIYSRLIRRFGLGGMLTITPLLLVITYIGWGFQDALIFPLMAFLVCEGTLYIVDDSNFNLLLNGVPSKMKYKVRLFIESFFEPTGTLVSAILLSIPFFNSKMVGLFFAIFLLGIGLTLRKLYPKALYSNLMDNAVHFERTPKEWLPALTKKERQASEARLLEILEMGNHAAQEFAIEGLIDFEDYSLLDRLFETMDKSSVDTRKIFLKKLTHSPLARDPRVIDLLLSWDQEETDSDWKGILHFYLAEQGLLSPQKALIDLKSSNLRLIGAALIALKKSSAFSTPQMSAELRILSAENLQTLLSSEDEEAIEIGLEVMAMDGAADDVNLFLPYLTSHSPAIYRKAASCIQKIATPEAARYAKQIIAHVETNSDRDFRIHLLQALHKFCDASLTYDLIDLSLHLRPNERRLIEKSVIQTGLRTVPTLIQITKNSTLPDRCRLLAGKILGRLSPAQLHSLLYAILREERERALFYFYHYQTMQKAYPDIDLQILRDALLSGYHSVMDFMIQLLSVAGEIEDSELLSRAMRSRNAKFRGQVVETLERTLEPPLFRLLQPLVDEWPIEETLKFYTEKPLTLEELIERLGNSSSLADQVASFALASQLQMPNWKQKLKGRMLSNEEIFNRFAYELLES